jgi:sugar phosphate isomerase/epimerase
MGASGRGDAGFSPVLGVSVMFASATPPGELIQRARAAGIEAVEIDLPYLDRWGDGTKALSRSLGEVTFHLPHDAEHGVLSPDPGRDAGALDAYERIMDRALELGCRTFTLHLMNVMGLRLEEYWGRSVDFARAMGGLAASRGAEVGLENCYPVVRSGAVAARFLAEVEHPAVGLTLDCGHFWSALCEDERGGHLENPVMRTAEGERVMNSMLDGMAALAAERIVNIHIHDVRRGDWLDHQPPGTGVMRYERLFEALRRVGYRRTVTIEIRPTGDWGTLQRSAELLRSLIAHARGLT